MDMANSHAAWVSAFLPDADIIYDRFHLIKLVNDGMKNLRRSTMNKLEDEEKKELKGKRMILLSNEFADPGTARLHERMPKEYTYI